MTEKGGDMSYSDDFPTFKVQIFVEPDGDAFHAYCPALVGLHTCGASVEEAISNAEDAAKAYLQSLLKHNEPLPIGICPAIEVKRHSPLCLHKSNIQQHTRDLQLCL